VGILGGGQLGRMLALAGLPLGVACRVLDPAADAPAAAAAEHVRAGFEDAAALGRLGEGVDVVTFEFENVPVAAARAAAGDRPLRPGALALEVAQDRLREKQLFEELAIAAAPSLPVGSPADLAAAVKSLGLPAVLKTRRLGYDGKGQRVLRGEEDVASAWEVLGGGELLLERHVAFSRELSILAVRGVDGETRAYPLVENRHRDGILRESLAPAPASDALQGEAERLAVRLLDRLGYVGVLALELFEVNGALLANEIAPRVHNSGHWTIEGAATSQFENHLRAVLGLPLGGTDARGNWAMVNLVGTAPPVADVLAIPDAHLHLYGKSPRPGRKLGHVTAPRRDERLPPQLAALVR
jgi:5-(carboxyamino)imidazole ribonucleotide synthase